MNRRFAPVWIIVVILILTLIAALMPKNAERTLDSYSANPGGARALYEALPQLGVRVQRREVEVHVTPLARNESPFAMLSPSNEVNALEIHAMLEHARQGATILVDAPAEPLVSAQPELDDSLTAALHLGAWQLAQFTSDTSALKGILTQGLRDSLPQGSQTLVWWVWPVEQTGTPVDSMLHANTKDSVALLVEVPLGRGRVVLLSDPALLANANVGHQSVIVAALAKIARSDSAIVTFDEVHHGHTQESVEEAAGDFLLNDPLGHTTVALLVALIVAMIPAAVRPGSILPSPSPVGHSAVDLAASLGRLLEEANDRDEVVRLQLLRLKRLSRWSGAPAANDRAWLGSLMARDPHRAPQVKALLAELNGGRDPLQISLLCDALLEPHHPGTHS